MGPNATSPRWSDELEEDQEEAATEATEAEEKQQCSPDGDDARTPLAATLARPGSSTARPNGRTALASFASYPTTGSGVRMHGNTERMPMWSRTNRLMRFVADTPGVTTTTTTTHQQQ